MANKVKLFLFAFLLSFQGAAYAITSKIEAKVDKTNITINEAVTFSVFVHNLNPEFVKFPQDTADYKVTATSNAKSFRLVNGQSDKSITYKYVLKPKHTGSFVIPSVKVKAGPLTQDTKPVTITVRAANTAAKPPPRLPKRPKNSARPRPQIQRPKQEIFAKFDISNTKPYPNEQVHLALKIYHRGNLRSLNVKPLQLDNFIVIRDNKAKEYQEMVDRNEFYIYEISYVIYPVKAGPVSIPETNIETVVIEDRDVNRVDPFRFMNPFLVERQRTLTTKEIKVEVQSFPKGAPKGFTGYVGELAVVHQLKEDSVKSGEALNLETKINGDGNFSALSPELVQESKQYSIFSDKDNLREEIVDSRSYFEASRSTALIANKNKGKLSIKTVPLVSFNPKAKKYEVHGSNKFEVKVIENPDAEDKAHPLLKNERLERKDPVSENKTMLTISSEAILNYKEPPIENRDLVLLIILVNFIAFSIKAFKYLKGKSSLLAGSNKNSIGSYIKRTKQAQRISEISIVLRELSNKINNKDKVEPELSKFFEESDRANYSIQGDSGSSEELEYFRSKAIELIKELANAK